MNAGSTQNQLMSEINVTPFVDVMLVLLIIFMVTAPMMVQGVDVALPETTSGPLPTDKEPLLHSQAKSDVYNTHNLFPLSGLWGGRALPLSFHNIAKRLIKC
jgi:biopolymer transport protein TolR